MKPGGTSAEVAQHLATRALSLARSGADREASVVVLRDLARGDRGALELARARCEAAVDQNPADVAARDAAALLAAALPAADG